MTEGSIKLSAKFARQESEETRRARIARRRIREDRVEAVRRMLGLPDEVRTPTPPRPHRESNSERVLACPRCERRFARPMHLGRHLQAAHA
ncbi:MAG: hypothetical protein ACREM3_11510 [Candidatus Rokuibacteriota bacterium]